MHCNLCLFNNCFGRHDNSGIRYTIFFELSTEHFVPSISRCSIELYACSTVFYILIV